MQNTEANIQHLEREMERGGLAQTGAAGQLRVKEEASAAGGEARLAVADEIAALVHAHAGKLQDLDRRCNTLAAAMAVSEPPTIPTAFVGILALVKDRPCWAIRATRTQLLLSQPQEASL